MRLGSILVSALLLGFASPAAAETRVTRVDATLRATASRDARVVAVVPASTDLAVQCGKVWCAASWDGAPGWLLRSDLRAAKGYINIDGERVPSPRPSANGPPAGSTAQCNDGTYSFSKHRGGTCSHHGGVKRWL